MEESPSMVASEHRADEHSSPWPARLGLVCLIVIPCVVGGIGIYLIDPWRWHSSSAGHDLTGQLETAQKALADRELETARDQLEQILALCPFNAEAQFLTARAYRRLQNFPAWRSHLFEATRLFWPRKQIEFEFQLQQAQIGDVWSVEHLLLDALDSRPPDEVELIQEALAEGYLKNHSVDKIMQLTGPWLERSPEAWLPHYYRGQVQFEEGTRRAAIEEFKSVLKLNPDYSLARLWLAGVLADEGQFKEALDLFETFLKENPGEPNGLFGLANCQFSLGHAGAARQALKELRSVAPPNPRALYLQAKLDADEDPAKAIEWLRQAEQLAPKEIEIANTMIVLLGRLNRKDEAKVYVERREEILALHDKMSKLKKELRKNPASADIRFQIGQVNVLLDRDSDAYDWFQTALRMDPNHQKTLKALELLAKKGEPPAKDATPIRPLAPAGPK